MIHRVPAHGGLVLVATLLAVLAVPPGAPAAAAQRVEPAPGTETQALNLLEWAARARESIGYTGVQFLSTWSAGGTSSFLVDVDHMPGGGTTMYVRGTSTGPEGVAVTVSDSDRSAGADTGLDAVSGSDLGLLGLNFDLAVQGRDTVAGRSAFVVAASRDGSTAARFWVDTSSGLLLRREAYDSSGTTIRASAFVDLRPARQVFLVQLPPELPQPWARRMKTADVDDLQGRGWTCPESMPSSLSLRRARLLDDPSGDIVHLSYSDGLSTVSVFEQRGHLDLGGLTGYRTVTSDAYSGEVYVDDGLPQRFVWSAGGTVYTVIGDAPADTVERVIAALPHDAADDGVTPRIRRGMERAMSWFNPFG